MKFYIDPGTGSMLFTILIGVFSAALYSLRGLFMKLRYSGGKKETNDSTIPYVIFSDSKRYWNVFKPICDEFEKREEKLTYYTMSKDDPAFDENYKYVTREFIGDGNSAFAKLNFLKADIVLSTTPGLDVYQWKRSKDVKCYIHVLHAIDDVTSYRMFGLDYYDALLLSGTHQEKEVRQLEELRNLKNKDIKLVGLSYFDDMAERLKNTKKIKNEKPVVLLAPSWGDSSILNKYGKKAIDALLSTGYTIVVRPHPQSYISEKAMLDKLMNDYNDNKELIWNKDNDNFNILNKADILISDFSGVLFDFSLIFDKPIMYADTSFDVSPYDAYWLKDQMWKFEVLPSIGEELKEESLGNIKEIIDNAIASEKFAKGREDARKVCWHNKGNATLSTVEYMISKRTELIEKED